MYSIVPDTPYDDTVTYLDCSNSGHQLAGNFAVVTDARTVSTIYSLTVDNSTGTTYIDLGDSTSNTPTYYTFGSGSANRCFISDQYYNAALNAYNTGLDEGSGGRGSSLNKARAWPPAIYKGNYLNWYFGSLADHTVADNFGTGATMKPGVNTRINIAKSAASTVVTGLDKVRVGLFTYDNPNNDYDQSGGKLLLAMTDLSTNRSAIAAAISSVAIVGSGPGTPLAETQAGIGRYFAKTGTDSSSYTPNLTLHPGQSNQSSVATTTVFPRVATNSSSSAAPIQAYCQKSFAILLTDGLATADRDINTNIQDYAGYCANNAWNCPAALGYGMRTYREAANCTQGNISQCVGELYESYQPSDYLDDVASALYDIDLRPDLVPPSGSKTGKNNILTYTIGIVDPTLDYSTLIARAAAKGGGLSFTARNAADLAAAFSSATDDILAKDGSAAAVASGQCARHEH